MIEVLVHHRILCILLWKIQHSIFAHPVWQYSQSKQYWVLLSQHETWAHLFVAKVHHFLAVHSGSGTPQDPHPRVSDTETRFRYSCLSCSFRCRVFPGLWLNFWYNWDLQSSRECGPWICMKPTLAGCDSVWIYHSGPGMPWEQQIRHQSACIPVCSALYILVFFILIIFSLTLNQCTQCTKNAIYQDTSRLGAGGSSHWASATILIYAWSGYWRPPLKCVELSAPCQLVRRRKVALCNYTINEQTCPISNPT